MASNLYTVTDRRPVNLDEGFRQCNFGRSRAAALVRASTRRALVGRRWKHKVYGSALRLTRVGAGQAPSIAR